jgi:hypothetical protein
VQALKESRLRYAWNIEKTDAGVLLRGAEGEIQDQGKEIIVHSEEVIAARGAVELAKFKKWQSIDVNGGSEAMLRAVVIEAHEGGLGIRVAGQQLTEEMIESYREGEDREMKNIRSGKANSRRKYTYCKLELKGQRFHHERSYHRRDTARGA